MMKPARRFPRFLWIPLLILFVFAGWKIVVAQVAATPPADVELVSDIVFGQGGASDLKLNITRPRTPPSGRMPVMIFIHGGGWSSGDRKDFHPFMFQFSKAGIFCASVQYRLAPKDRFPAQIQDVKCAVRWLRAHADEYQIDTTRMIAFGGSAGAHLAALLATTSDVPEFEGTGGNPGQSSAVNAAICLAGPYDLELGYRHSTQQRPAEANAVRGLLPSLLGGKPDEVPDAYRKASPITYARKECPPLLLVHGEDDPLVLIEQAEVFTKKLQDVGATVQFLRLPGGTHDSFGKEPDKAVRTITDFARAQFGLPGGN